MADDWKPGDLALCVKSGKGIVGMGRSRDGAIYTVSEVFLCPDTGAVRLRFKGITYPRDPRYASTASRFRKIHPHTPDEQDEETIRLLNLVEA